MLYTKEFYELIKNFEKYAEKNLSLGSMGLQKEEKELWKKQRYYCDGTANQAFIIFFQGYSLGKSMHQQ